MVNFAATRVKSAFLTLPITGLLVAGLLVGCTSPEPGPDKTIGGAVLGAGWGAGAGAVVGNQLGATGEGVAVGSGFGLVNGAVVGFQADNIEDAQINQERQLEALKIQTTANLRELQDIQYGLDQSAATGTGIGSLYQVYFDVDETSLKVGSIANLETIADGIKRSLSATKVHVVGNSDDAGSPAYNDRLAEARARNVSQYLASRGISVDQIIVTSFGAKRPVASNGTETGRQLNRRVDIYTSAQ